MFKYEGCGEIGSLRAIFLAQFHHLQGPMIRCQYPDDLIDKENFDLLSRFLIPKNEVQEQTITVNSNGYKISGYPTFLPDKKYPRNYLLFNLCVVCHPWSRTVQFEPFVKKLSQFFTNLEKEAAILSEDMEENSENSIKIKSILEKVFNDMNHEGKTVVTHEQNTLHLSVINLGSEPTHVGDHKVPVLVENLDEYHTEEFDLTSTKILPHIDGFNSVARIAMLSDVEVNAVRACVQNLLYHKVVELTPMFLYSNVYTTTPKLAHLFKQPEFRDDIQSYNLGGTTPSLRDLYSFICLFCHGRSLREVCHRQSPQKLGIDERKLIQYLVLKGMAFFMKNEQIYYRMSNLIGALRRIERYPVYQVYSISIVIANTVQGDDNDESYTWFTRGYPTDLILIKSGMSSHELELRMEEDPDIYILNR